MPQVRVTSWGLPLCGPIPVACTPEETAELSLRVHVAGLVAGLVLFVAALAVLAPLAVTLAMSLPGFEPVVLLATAAAVVATCLLDFYALLPALSTYTFRLVRTGAAPGMDTTDLGQLK